MRKPGSDVPAFVASVLLASTLTSPAQAGEKGAGRSGEREFTLGLVQKELKVGMSQVDVASAIGSPNLVTRGREGREAWVYDKVATEARIQSSGVGGGIGGIGAPATSLILGLLGGHVQDVRTLTTQKTLTVVIRFDEGGSVESFSFHSSRF